MKKLLDNLTNNSAAKMLADAINDKSLFESLLVAPTSPLKERKVFQRLNAWMLWVGAESLEEPLRGESLEEPLTIESNTPRG